MESLRQRSGLPGSSVVRPADANSQETEKEIRLTPNVQERSTAGNAVSSEVPDGECLPGRDADQFGSGPKGQTALSIGIVVPVLNEGKTLPYFLSRLYEVSRARYPVVVVDGGSTDGSLQLAQKFFHTETLSPPNRGKQLNYGARCLLTDVLLFLHADTELPRGFDFYIQQALMQRDVAGGCFRLEFDVQHPLLKAYAWFTRFSGRFFHFGDQGFFVRRDVFWKLDGFSAMPFLEDVDFLRRLKRHGKFVTLSVPVRTSARRFLRCGIVRQQLRNILLVVLFELGVSAERLAGVYPHVR